MRQPRPRTLSEALVLDFVEEEVVVLLVVADLLDPTVDVVEVFVPTLVVGDLAAETAERPPEEMPDWPLPLLDATPAEETFEAVDAAREV